MRTQLRILWSTRERAVRAPSGRANEATCGTSSTIASALFCGALVLGCVERDLEGSAETTATTGSGTGTGDGGTGVTTSGDVDPTTPTSGGPTSSPPGSSSSPPDPSAGTMTGESGETGEPDDGGSNFIPGGRDQGGPDCDIFAQDCPEGQKCAAWASDGGNAWNTAKCVDITGDQKPGEACKAEGGGFSGEDDCVKGAMCWDVDAEGQGTCIPLCTGSADRPSCEEGLSCAEATDGVLSICLPLCDPLAQGCPGDDVCIPVGDAFVCVPDASGEEGQVFDACAVANGCDPGLVCAGSGAASECDQRVNGCCVPMCSISGMIGCPGVGQECLSLWGEGMAPPEFADIGYCAVPA